MLDDLAVGAGAAVARVHALGVVAGLLGGAVAVGAAAHDDDGRGWRGNEASGL